MIIDHISGSQLSPDEVRFIASEFGCTEDQVRMGNIPTQPVNQQYMPQYNPYQYMQGGMTPYDRPMMQPVQYPYMYNQYGYAYQPQYANGYVPMYSSYVAPQPYPQMYYPQYYSQNYNPEVQANLQYRSDYRERKLSGNPLASHIKLVMDYRSNPSGTYFGYTPYNYGTNMYGFTMSEEDRILFKNPDNFLQNQKDMFEMITKGAALAGNNKIPDDDVKKYYIEKTTPDESTINTNTNPFHLRKKIIDMRRNMAQIGYAESLSKQTEQIYNYRRTNYINAVNKKMEETRKVTPEDMTLSQFLEIGGELYSNCLYENYTNNFRRNLTNSYVQAHYNANVRPPLEDPNYYSAMFKYGQTDVGDICISPPSFITKSYEERRQRFINALIKGNDDLPF